MKLYLRVHYGWLPKENTEGIPKLDESIENALKPLAFINTGKNLELGLRDLSISVDLIRWKQDKEGRKTKILSPTENLKRSQNAEATY